MHVDILFTVNLTKNVDLQEGASCLFVASEKGHLDIVKYLCKKGGKQLLMLSKIVGFTHVYLLYVCV